MKSKSLLYLVETIGNLQTNNSRHKRRPCVGTVNSSPDEPMSQIVIDREKSPSYTSNNQIGSLIFNKISFDTVAYSV